MTTKVTKTEQYKDSQGEHLVCRGKLVLLPLEEPIVIGGHNPIRPIIISETEEVEVGDKFIWIDGLEKGIFTAISDLVYIGKDEIPISLIGSMGRKTLALSENFSPKHLQAIVDGKLKDGDEVFVACEQYKEIVELYDFEEGEVNDWYDDIINIIKLNKDNHIKLFPVKKEFSTPMLEWLREYIKNTPLEQRQKEWKQVCEEFDAPMQIADEYSLVKKEERLYKRDEVMRMCLVSYQEGWRDSETTGKL